MPLALANIIGTLTPNNTNVPPAGEPIWPDVGPPFDENDWKEAVNLYSPNQLAIGHHRSHTTLIGYIPWAKYRAAMLFFCGLSWIDADLFLRRSIPSRHPVMSNLYANEIVEVKSVKFVSKHAQPFANTLPYAEYAMAMVTVAYSQPPYDILTDADLGIPTALYSDYAGLELFRYVRWTPAPYLDQYTVQQGTFMFTDTRGVPDPPPAPPTKFDGVPAGIGVRMPIRAEKSILYVDWFDVPLPFVTNSAGLMKKLMQAQGCINDDVFLGEPAHTWLLDKVEPLNGEVFTDPIATVATTGLARRVDLRFTFRYFGQEASDASGEHGWRLNPTFTGDWLPVVYSQAPLQVLPKEVNFLKLFTHVDDAF